MSRIRQCLVGLRYRPRQIDPCKMVGQLHGFIFSKQPSGIPPRTHARLLPGVINVPEHSIEADVEIAGDFLRILKPCQSTQHSHFARRQSRTSGHQTILLAISTQLNIHNNSAKPRSVSGVTTISARQSN